VLRDGRRSRGWGGVFERDQGVVGSGLGGQHQQTARPGRAQVLAGDQDSAGCGVGRGGEHPHPIDGRTAEYVGDRAGAGEPVGTGEAHRAAAAARGVGGGTLGGCGAQLRGSGGLVAAPQSAHTPRPGGCRRLEQGPPGVDVVAGKLHGQGDVRERAAAGEVGDDGERVGDPEQGQPSHEQLRSGVGLVQRPAEQVYTGHQRSAERPAGRGRRRIGHGAHRGNTHVGRAHIGLV